MDLFSNAIAILGLVALTLVLKLWKKANSSKGKLVPEVAGGLPIIGHMHLLSEKKSLGRIFGNFADKYGPIFSVRLGMHPAIFVSDYNAIKECFTINDIIISSRPSSTQAKFVGYNGSSFGFAPYGPYWRNMRKFVAIKLLSSTRIKMLNYIPESEVNYLMKNLYNLSNDKIDIGECINQMIVNIITRMVAGKRVFDGNKDRVEGRTLSQIVSELLDIAGQVVPGDVIPFIAWLDIKGVVKTMKSISDEVASIVDGWIEEHKENYNKKTEDQKDFIDVMLSELTDDADMGFDQHTIIKGTAMTMIIGGSDTTTISLVWALSNLLNNKEALEHCQKNSISKLEGTDDEEMGLDQATIIKGTTTTIIIGASDTTSISLTWALSNLMNNKKVLERCQEEIDLKVEKNRCVQVEDIPKLAYLSVVIKETLRLYPPGPIGTPKIVGEDCYMSGYFVPKGSYLFLNIWKLHRDPSLWSNPEEFIPERFLNEKSYLDITGNSYEYLPFSAGRRSCPGNNFAMHVMSLSLARLLQGFNITTPGNKYVDMTEGQNMIMHKEHNLELVLTPRLEPHLYNVN